VIFIAARNVNCSANPVGQEVTKFSPPGNEKMWQLSKRILPFLAAGAGTTLVVTLHLVDISVLSQVGKNLIEALHAPGFAAVSVVSYVALRRKLPVETAILGALMISVALAFTSEAAQLIGTRNAEWSDIVADVRGICAGMLLVAAASAHVRRRIGRLFTVLLSIAALMATFLAFAPSVRGARLLLARAQAFPVIADFDAAWQQEFYRATHGATLAAARSPIHSDTSQDNALQIALSAQRYSGLALEPYPDWSGYRELSFVAATLDGLEHEIVMRIHDAMHNQQVNDRFNRVLKVGPVPTRYRIAIDDVRVTPSGRSMNLREVAGLTIFKSTPNGTEVLLLDDFRLD
jgi:hypothetical protein